MSLTAITLCLFALAAPASGAPAHKPAVNITSERFEILPNAERALWTGSVVAQRGDLRLSCDKLTAEFDTGERRRIKSLVCEGNVHMLQRRGASGPGSAKSNAADREAWGDRAHFDNKRGLVTVTGNPKAREGENRIHGEKVLIYVEEDRVVVEKPKMVLETEVATGSAP
ncbi:MAG: LptA/OstA family protein [Myxococcales bacterium]|jgi:lipopolysaccharide export system protein LptA|nr:LptA/OstA family protein [Myxococcales bacterium]